MTKWGQTLTLAGTLIQHCWKKLACHRAVTSICVAPLPSWGICAMGCEAWGVLSENVHTEIFGALESITPGMAQVDPTPHLPEGAPRSGPFPGYGLLAQQGRSDSCSLCFWNKTRYAGCYYLIQSLSDLNAIDFVERFLRKSRDVEILFRAGHSGGRGKQSRAALDRPSQQHLCGRLSNSSGNA